MTVAALVKPIPRPGWQSDAVCAEVDSELFVIEMGQKSDAAIQICNTPCPVRLDCLAWYWSRPPVERRGIVAGGWHFPTKGQPHPHPADVASGLADLYIRGGEAEHANQH